MLKLNRLSLVKKISIILSIFLFFSLASTVSFFEVYKNVYLTQKLTNTVQLENEIKDKSLRDIFYNIVILKEQIYTSDNLSNFDENKKDNTIFKATIDHIGYNKDIYLNFAYYYENNIIFYDDINYLTFGVDLISENELDNVLYLGRTSIYDDYNYSVVVRIKNNERIYLFFLNNNYLSSILSNSRKSLFILSNDQNYCYMSNDNIYLDKNIYDLDNIKQTSKIIDIFNHKWFLVSSRLDNISNLSTNLYLLTFFDYNSLFSQINSVEIIATSILSIVLLFFIVGTFVLYRKTILPINHLSKELSSLDVNNISVSKLSKKESKNEIDILENSYLSLISRIEDLLENEKIDNERSRKLELDSLQIQINPHFLYNALDTIAWMAKIEKNKDIEQFVISLAHFYRLSLHKGEKYISIKDEIDIAKYYLYIQIKRFPQIFTFDIDYDENLSPYKTLKLILQPFVENIIKYAFNDISYPGLINIKAIKEDEYAVFSIKDNGVGFDVNKLNELKNNNSRSGYGIKNVLERLSLEYKTNYYFHIDSSINKGTVITIKIPLDKKDN